MAIGSGDASAQSRRRTQEPPPPDVPLPTISDQHGRCSFAFHQDLTEIAAGNGRDLGRFESLARVGEPGLSGRWLFWVKSAKGTKTPTTEQVCAETAIRNGRDRCVKWQTRPIDPVIVGAQPTADELALLRSLDGFVTDKGAMLEFGPNGRQFVVLQRYAGEMANYIGQPRHPALCNGVPQMMDFQSGNLAGLKKRVDDVAAMKAKAAAFARQRVVAAREVRIAAARAAAAVPEPTPVSADTGAAGAAPPAPKPSVPPAPQGAVPATASAGELIGLALEGLLSPERRQLLDAEAGPYRKLQRARELVSANAMPEIGGAARASLGAALRMIEAMVYADAQANRMKPFEAMFLGTIEQIRGAHQSKCTCGEN